MKSKYSFLLIALLWCLPALSQVSVAPNCALGKCQFFDRNGNPLAGGKVFSYSAGTTSLVNTYKDSGGVAQNTDPIILDAGGWASVWLANQAYKFCVYNSASVLQYSCVDGVTGYFGVLNSPNTWSLPQTFSGTITDTLTDNQIVLGAPGNTTTADFPPPATNVTLHFPITTDTMVGRDTTDTLTHKTLTSPIVNTPAVTGGTFSTPAINVLKNTTVVTQTGDTAAHTIYTVPIPAGLMGPNNLMRITLCMDTNVTAGGPIVQIKYGGTLISPAATLSATLANTNGVYAIIIGGNLGVTNSQAWDDLEVAWGNPVAVGNLQHHTSAIDSTVLQNVTVTYTGGANADSVTFRRILIEIL